MLEFSSIVVFAAHLVLANLAMAGPLACMGLEWRATRRGDSAAGQVGLALARWSLWSFALALALGAALLALVWQLDAAADSAAYSDAVRGIPPARLWMSLSELVFYGLCMGAYLACWDRLAGGWRWLHRALALSAATDLMYHFPPLFAMLAVLSSRAELAGKALDRATYHALLLDPEVLARVAHVWLAALATAGVAVMWLAARQARRAGATSGAAPPAAALATVPLIVWGARLALAPTLLQLPAGVWLLFQMPYPARFALMGQNATATGLFCLSILAALRLMHLLATAALGDADAGKVRQTLWTIVATIGLMAATLHFVEG